jgi:carboxypeptidase Q
MNWAGGWGVNRIFSAQTREIPTFELSCEDYGLVFRLADNDQGAVLRVNFEAEFLGDVPVYNTIATIPGSELPDEYVMLSAHFDSWDGSSGATDNGTGTVLMMEVMRIIREVYPNPRRTIKVGHWGGEEQGLNGSRAFAEDHPELVENLQALFNQDNGTGRVVGISMQGFVEAGSHFARWLSQVPSEVTQHIDLTLPGMPSSGGTDHAAFVCWGAPAFSLSALNWDYFTYTWHTNRDTFDKVVVDDIQNNAVLLASLVYLASEDPERVSREQRTAMPVSPQTGQPATWPTCPTPRRSF